MTRNHAVQPCVVTPEMRNAAQAKADELFAALVAAKDEWQYAVKDQDEKYHRVLALKGEYSEWRALAQNLGAALAGGQPVSAVQPATLGEGAAQLFASLSARRYAGER